MKLKVNLETNCYDIIIEKGCLENCGSLIKSVIPCGRCVLVTDSNVDKYYSDTVIRSLESAGFDTVKFVFPAGEESKTLNTLSDIYTFMAENKINRGDFLVALGGGVTGDISGFAAATYMRGIKYIQIPTSLLAQVDSSVGGKVAVDLPQGKNMVGNFYHPKLVIIDPNVLSTLKPEFFTDGMAEVIKYGCIRDNELFDKLCTYSRSELDDNIESIIYTCVDIKRQVVENDERDTGERMILNFGHTIGHAIEKFYNFKEISHGMAVAIGMYMMTKLSEKFEITPVGVSDKILACLTKYGLPYSADEIPADKIAEFATGDKKNFGKILNIIVLNEIGSCRILSLQYSEFAEIIGSGERI